MPNKQIFHTPIPQPKKKEKKLNLDISPRQEANQKARDLGGKLLNAHGYMFYIEDRMEHFGDLQSFMRHYEKSEL